MKSLPDHPVVRQDTNPAVVPYLLKDNRHHDTVYPQCPERQYSCAAACVVSGDRRRPHTEDRHDQRTKNQRVRPLVH